jgi:hypothetical protein
VLAAGRLSAATASPLKSRDACPIAKARRSAADGQPVSSRATVVYDLRGDQIKLDAGERMAM